MSGSGIRQALFALGVVSILGTGSNAGAGSCHVDPVNGDDVAGNGTTILPWKTIRHALIQPCSEIHLAAGTYSTASGESFPVFLDGAQTLIGTPDHRSVLASGGLRAVLMEGTDFNIGAHLRDLVIDGHDRGGRSPASGVEVLWATSGMDITGCEIRGFASAIFWDPLVALDVSSLRIERNRLVDNGTGIRIESSSIGRGDIETSDIRNNVFDSNDMGLEMSLQEVAASTAVTNNTFVRCTGSALRLASSTDPGLLAPQVINNIFASNGGTVIDDALAAPATIDRNLFWLSPGRRWAKGVNATPDNFDGDPNFVDPGAGDFHLALPSWAVDAGNESLAAELDWDGGGRPVDGDGNGVARADIGADERSPAGNVLRRADVVALAPVTPALSAVFPMGPANLLTPAILTGWPSGVLDPELGIWEDPTRRLLLYQSDGPETIWLRGQGTVYPGRIQIWIR